MCHPTLIDEAEKKTDKDGATKETSFVGAATAATSLGFSRDTRRGKRRSVARRWARRLRLSFFAINGTDGLVYLRWKIHSDRCYSAPCAPCASTLDPRSWIEACARLRLRNRATRLSFSLSLSFSEIVTVTLTTRQQRGLLVISIRRPNQPRSHRWLIIIIVLHAYDTPLTNRASSRINIPPSSSDGRPSRHFNRVFTRFLESATQSA